MSKTDSTYINDSGDLTQRVNKVEGRRVSAPDKLSKQVVVRDDEGKEHLAEKVDANITIDEIPGLRDALNNLTQTDSNQQQQISDNKQSVSEEANTRQKADEALQKSIDTANRTRETADSELRTNIDNVLTRLNDEIARSTLAENNLEQGKISKSTVSTAVTSIALIDDKNAVSVSVVNTDTDSGMDKTTTLKLPTASATQAGVMPKETYETVMENASRLAVLEGAAKRYPVYLPTENVTQAQYQLAWENASGKATGTEPADGDTLVNLNDNHAITYYVNAPTGQEHWIDRGVDTVSMATNTVAGMVKGDGTTSGKVFVETDGSMSVNGWDDLAAQIEQKNVMHLSGDETVDGYKTFVKYIKVKYNNIVASDVPTAYTELGLFDMQDTSGKLLSTLRYAIGVDGTVQSVLYARKYNVDGTYTQARIGVGVKADGSAMTYAPHPVATTSGSSNEIATVGWVNSSAHSLGLVHKSGNESINGDKKFLATLSVSYNSDTAFRGFLRGQSNYFIIGTMNANSSSWNSAQIKLFSSYILITAGMRWVDAYKDSQTVPTANRYWSPIEFRDKNDLQTGYIRNIHCTDDRMGMDIQTVRQINGTYKYASIGVYIKGDGTVVTDAPHPAASSNGTNIATTSWCRGSTSMPSSKYDTLTLGASGTEYTAPADGWYELRQTGMSSSTSIWLQNTSTGLSALQTSYYSSGVCETFVPVKSGHKVKITYGSGKAEKFRFIYAVRSSS